VPVPSIVFVCVGSSSPHNSDDEQKMNNFIEKVKTKSRKFSKMVASDIDVEVIYYDWISLCLHGALMD